MKSKHHVLIAHFDASKIMLTSKPSKTNQNVKRTNPYISLACYISSTEVTIISQRFDNVWTISTYKLEKRTITVVLKIQTHHCNKS